MQKTTKNVLLLALLLIGLVVLVFCLRSYLKKSVTQPQKIIQENQESVGIANPASVYCKDNGGKSEIKNNEEGQYGMCVFPDGSQCDEWKFFRKECGVGDSNISPEKDLELITQALVLKDGIDLDLVDVSIGNRVNNFVSGSISPKEEGIGGAYFFAVKNNGVWKILASGNGIIKCEDIKDYPNFPINMIPACISKNGELERRDLPL